MVTLRLWQSMALNHLQEAQTLSGEKRVVMQKGDLLARPAGVPTMRQCFEAIVKPAATGLFGIALSLRLLTEQFGLWCSRK